MTCECAKVERLEGQLSRADVLEASRLLGYNRTPAPIRPIRFAVKVIAPFMKRDLHTVSSGDSKLRN